MQLRLSRAPQHAAAWLLPDELPVHLQQRQRSAVGMLTAALCLLAHLLQLLPTQLAKEKAPTIMFG
jgi:hypothetical protein